MSDQRPDLARPTIGLSTSELRVPERVSPLPEGEPARRELALGLVYVNAVARAGGLPVILPPLPPSFAAPLLEAVDGLCIPGGPDIHPRLYGHEPHDMLGPTEMELDAFELALVAEALERGMPVLGICRGAQMINVAAGGTLHQHLPACVDGALPHRQEADLAVSTHPVRVAGESRLAACLGGEVAEVNSLHHQAVDRLGAGLEAVAWAPDGVVEAVEGTGGGFLLGVQWHAEGLVDRPEAGRLIAAFVAAAAERRARAVAGPVA
ncbi:MAG TPA: gamma-glutamyl-gamma-aminobutyrate hydrolase family protein [Miltoncostaeaceae bacterium]|nr:gamma-glutamyl-gamma-aminobutyrate hydrolase family protein [Miltoncostaeaceae bacterium]